jgi:cobalt-zinc-cadmium resistance protein CzcA
LVKVPLGPIGGIFALLLTGIPLNVSGTIGFIALIGHAVLNGMVTFCIAPCPAVC